MRTLFLGICCCMVTACSSTEQRTYDLYLENHTQRELTFGLVKNGPPPEYSWDAPEDIEYGGHSGDATWGIVVKPGEIGHLTLPGRFGSRTNAVLRVYANKRLVDELVAVMSTDPYQIRQLVEPGKRTVLIEDPGSGLLAKWVKPARPAPP